MRTISIGIQKGGTGKTTTTFNLGYALADRGRRVLMVDLDPQSSLTVSAGIDDTQGSSMAEVLTKSMPLVKIIDEVGPGWDLAPADIALSEAELSLTGRIGREMAVKRILEPLGDRYDYCLLDLPPSLGVLTVNGLAAADQVLIPMVPNYLDMRALAIFTQTVDLVREEINPGLEVLGVLPTFYDARLKLHGEVLQALDQTGIPVLPVRIKRSIRYAEAPIGSEPLAAYSPEHAEVYSKLAEEVDGKA